MVAPEKALVVTEHWSDSGSAVILSGSRSTLEEIARLLDLPVTRVIITPATSPVLGIWGEHLSAYEELKRAGKIGR